MTMANNSTSPAGFRGVLAFLEEGRHRLPYGRFITLNTFPHPVRSTTIMRHSLTSEKAKLAEALKTRPVCGRAAARAAGLKLFTGPLCPVRSHGNIRRASDGQCVECLEAAERIKADARDAGRAAALKKARAEVAREQKAAERERLKQEKAAEHEREKTERVKAARAATRAKRKAERLAVAGAQMARPEPLEVAVGSPPWDAGEGDDESPPWE